MLCIANDFSDGGIFAPATNTLRRTTTSLDSRVALKPPGDPVPKKRKSPASPGLTRRKPTLIRNLGTVNNPKGMFSDISLDNR
mgnify:FL=1